VNKLRVLENNLNEVDTNLRVLNSYIEDHKKYLSELFLNKVYSVVNSHSDAMDSLRDLIESNEIK